MSYVAVTPSTIACLTLSLAFAAFQASNVLIPQWLQSNMGYTATWAGYATGLTGVLAVGVLVASTAVLSAGAAASGQSASAKLAAVADTVAIPVGAEVTVRVRVDVSGGAVNAVAAMLSYPQEVVFLFSLENC